MTTERGIIMKKKIIFYSLIAGLTLPICMAAVLLAKKINKEVIRADAERTITVTSEEFALSDLETSYQQLIVHELDGKDAPVFNYFLAKKDANDNLVLAPSGRIYNYDAEAAYSGRITNLVSMRVVYTGGTLFIQEGIGGNAETYGPKESFGSDVLHNFTTSPNYFMISNSGAETTITSISYTFTCEEAGYDIERLGDTYNGKGSDGNVYTFKREGDTLTINDSIHGVIHLDSLGNFTITIDAISTTYTGSVSSDYRTLKITGKTGDGPNFAELNRVYVIDDFESYASRGVGFTHDQASVFTATNLRSAYYVDAKDTNYVDTEGPSWIGTSGFYTAKKDANFLNLDTTVKHGGNKAMILQGRKAGWARLWSADCFNSHQHFSFGKGDLFSFWAHGAYTNPSLGSYKSTNDIQLRINVYYGTKSTIVNESNRTSTSIGTGTKSITIPANSDWTQYSISLDPSKNVTGINIMVNNQDATTSSALATDFVFVPIDDITVSTAPVYEPTKKYEQTATQFTKSYHGTVRVDTGVYGEKDFTMKVGLGANGGVYAYCGADMEAIDYTVTGSTIVIRTSGSYSTLTFGNWTGTLSNSNNTITIQKADITGSIKSQVKTDTIVLNQDNVLADDQGSSTLQAMLKRQHYSSSVWNDSSGTDTITQNTDYYMSGSSSIRLKPWADGNIRMIIQPSVAEAQSANIECISFWFYVPAGVNYKLSIFNYADYTPSSESGHYYQMYENTYDGVSDPGWHYVSMGTKEGYRKNVGVWVGQNAKQTILDYVTYF